MSRPRSKKNRRFVPGDRELKKSSRRNMRGLVIVLAGLAALIGLLLLWNRGLPRRQAGSAGVPQVSLAGLEFSVAERLRQHLNRVSNDPESAQAWGELGLVLRAYDFQKPALTCLAEAERRDPSEPRWPYFQSLLLQSDDPDQALARLRRAVELCGNEPPKPRLRLATLLVEAGRWEEAEREIQELLRINSNFAPALLLKARRAQAHGDFSAAERLVNQCASDSHTSQAAAILMAGLLARRGEMEAAREWNEKLKQLPPDLPVADPFEFEAALLRADPRILTEQTHPLLAAGRLPEAQANVDRLLRDFPNYGETWLLAGRLHYLQGEMGSAEHSLQRHLQLEPDSSQGYFQLGSVQLSQREYARAAQSFEKAIELKPDFGPAYYNKGFAYAHAGALGEAREAFQNAVRLSPERIDSYLMLAELALRQGQSAEFTQQLERARSIQASHPGIAELEEKARRLPAKR